MLMVGVFGVKVKIEFGYICSIDYEILIFLKIVILKGLSKKK